MKNKNMKEKMGEVTANELKNLNKREEIIQNKEVELNIIKNEKINYINTILKDKKLDTKNKYIIDNNNGIIFKYNKKNAIASTKDTDKDGDKSGNK